MNKKGLGYILPGRGSLLHSTENDFFVRTLDLLWEFAGESERVWRLDDDVSFIYVRKNGETGINCGDEFFYELAGEQLRAVEPDRWDKFGSGNYGEYFLE